MIRITEISAGDWVLYEGKPRQVVSVFGTTEQVVLNDEDISDWPEEDKAYYSPVTFLANLEPIEITEGFLKENGFKQIETGDWLIDGFHYQLKDHSLMEWVSWQNDMFYVMDINFVHELQHFFRLRGMEKHISLDEYEDY